MPLVFEDNFRVYQFECDPWDRMSPGAMLRRVQEIGTMQCESLGLNEDHYQKTHTVFLLSRISLEIYKAPALEQEIKIQTRAYGMHRAVYQRVTSLHDEEGNTLAEADSRWVLVDTTTRRILRREPEGFNSPFVEMPGAEGHEMETPKPGELMRLGSLVANYSLCDRNGHVNNTRYADVVCDYLPLEQLQYNPINKMLLFYRSEIPMGGEFTVHRADAGEDGYFFLAQQGERKSFECYVTLARR